MRMLDRRPRPPLCASGERIRPPQNAHTCTKAARRLDSPASGQLYPNWPTPGRHLLLVGTQPRPDQVILPNLTHNNKKRAAHSPPFKPLWTTRADLRYPQKVKRGRMIRVGRGVMDMETMFI